MLPGDATWDLVKQTGIKLSRKDGYVIEEGAEGFQFQDCMYYLYSHSCLIVKSRFRWEMSCGFVSRQDTAQKYDFEIG